MPSPSLTHRELTGLAAVLMAINALCIDLMLPALPEIGVALQVPHANDRQLVIVCYVMASGIAQLAYGPLTDAFGRRKVLLLALLLGAVGSLGCWAAGSFGMLLVARGVQGVAGASTRVVSTALVRDLVSGARMAQILSTAMMIFLVVPIVAPSIGQAMLSVLPSWRWLFAFLCLAFLALAAWCALRLPETLPVEKRVPMRMRSLLAACGEVLRSRATMGYTMTLTVSFGAMFAFLTSAQQLGEVFALGSWFPLAFACTGITLATAQFANRSLVMQLGTRILAWRAALGYAAITVLHTIALLFLDGESLAVFALFMVPGFFLFGFLGPNFNAMAMEPMGHVAGSAAALGGFVSTVGGAVLGGAVGRAYDGTTRPFVYGQALLGVAALLILIATERSRRRAAR